MRNIEDINNIKFEINIYTYNQSDYIIGALKSAIEQSVKAYKISLYDDCSTDDTFEKVSRYIREHSIRNVELHKNISNLGVFGNYNQMVDKATGEVILSLAGDDLLELDALEKYQEYISNNKDNLSDDFWLIPNIKEFYTEGEDSYRDYYSLYKDTIFEAILSQKMRAFEVGLSLSAYKQSRIRTDLGYQADNLKTLSGVKLFDTRLMDFCAYKYRLDAGVTVKSKRNTYLESRVKSLTCLLNDYSRNLSENDIKLTNFELKFAQFRLEKTFKNYYLFLKSIFVILPLRHKTYSNITLIKWLVGGFWLSIKNSVI